jgi:hypothetical protein
LSEIFAEIFAERAQWGPQQFQKSMVFQDWGQIKMLWRVRALFVCFAISWLALCANTASSQEQSPSELSPSCCGVNKKNIDAYIALKNYLKPLKFKLLRWYYVDLNRDASPEIVALIQSEKENNCAVWVLEWDLDLKAYKQVWEHKSSSLCTSSDSVEAFNNGRLRICEAWRVQGWRNETCTIIEYSAQWKARVIEEGNAQTEEPLRAQKTSYYNFELRDARRAYLCVPQLPSMPLQQRQTRYSFIYSEWQDELEALPAPVAWDESKALALKYKIASSTPRDWFGATDDKLFSQSKVSVQSRWNTRGISLGIWIHDKDIALTHSYCGDDSELSAYDHIAIWFDLNPSYHRDTKTTEDWELKYAAAYAENPYRHEMDPEIFALAVLPNACAVYLHPAQEEHWYAKPEIKSSKTHTGYFIEVFFPAAFFRKQILQKQKHFTQNLGLSVIYHDLVQSDEELIFQNLANSEWKWGDPYSFGELLLLPPASDEKPLFPLQWDKWLSGQ